MEKCPHGLGSPRFIGVNESERMSLEKMASRSLKT